MSDLSPTSRNSSAAQEQSTAIPHNDQIGAARSELQKRAADFHWSLKNSDWVACNIHLKSIQGSIKSGQAARVGISGILTMLASQAGEHVLETCLKAKASDPVISTLLEICGNSLAIKSSEAAFGSKKDLVALAVQNCRFDIARSIYEKTYVQIHSQPVAQAQKLLFATIDSLNGSDARTQAAAASFVDLLISNRPEIIDRRNTDGFLPVMAASDRQAWPVVNVILARNLERKERELPFFEELAAIKVHGLCSQAPHTTLTLCETALEFSVAADGQPFEVAASHQRALLNKIMLREWNEARSVLNFLENLVQNHASGRSELAVVAMFLTVGPEQVFECIDKHKHQPTSGLRTLHIAMLNNAPVDLLVDLIKVDGLSNVNSASRSFLYPAYDGPLKAMNLLHLALLMDHTAAVHTLNEHFPELWSKAGHQGQCPLEMYTRIVPQVSINSELLEEALSLAKSHKKMEGPLQAFSDALYEHGLFANVLQLHPKGLPVPQKLNDQSITIERVPGQFETVAGLVALKEIVRLAARLDPDQKTEVFNLFQKHGNLQDFYWHTAAYEQVETYQADERKEHSAFFNIVRRAFYAYELRDIAGLLSSLDAFHDRLETNHKQKPDRHPNEAEIALLFSHPKLSDLYAANTGGLTLASTSIHRFTNVKANLTPDAIVNITELGLLTNTHLRYRYDTRKAMSVESLDTDTVLPPLIQTFAFSPIPARPTDTVNRYGSLQLSGFGNGFLLRPGSLLGKHAEVWDPLLQQYEAIPLLSDTLVEFRRGYFLVSNPAYGTLIIRNSSQVFGRDTLLHPAYYTSENLSFQQLQNLTVDQIEKSFKHTMHNSLHRPTMLVGPQLKIRQLIGQFRVVQHTYSAHLCDTDRNTAFKPSKDGKPKLVGGWLSPGFKPMIERLRCWYDESCIDFAMNGVSKDKLPDLAFVHKRHPAWQPYTFKDAEGRTVHTLEINARRMLLLEQLADLKDHRTTPKLRADLRATSLDQFFKMGFANQADLIFHPGGLNKSEDK